MVRSFFRRILIIVPFTSLCVITDSWVCAVVTYSNGECVLMGRGLVSCHRQEVPLVSATAQAAFAPVQVHRPTPIAVRVKQAIASACLCTVALVPLPMQAMLVAGMWFPAVWRVE